MMGDWLSSVEAEGVEVPGWHLWLKRLQPVSGDVSSTAAGIKPSQGFQAGSTHWDGQPWPASDAPTETPMSSVQRKL